MKTFIIILLMLFNVYAGKNIFHFKEIEQCGYLHIFGEYSTIQLLYHSCDNEKMFLIENKDTSLISVKNNKFVINGKKIKNTNIKGIHSDRVIMFNKISINISDTLITVRDCFGDKPDVVECKFIPTTGDKIKYSKIRNE